MAGLADIFGGGSGAFGSGGLYGDLLTPDQKQALAWRGLAAAAGALGQAAMPSRMPVPLGAALGQAAAAMGSSQDEAGLAALKALLYGSQAKEALAKAKGLEAVESDKPPDMSGLFGATPAPARPAVAQMTGAAPVQSGDSLGGGLSAGGALAGNPLDLIEKFESGGRNIMQQVVPPGGGYNPSVGRVTGPSTAQGYYQITNSTWRDTAPKAGVDLAQFPTAMSAPKEIQAKVAQTLFDEQGFKPWAPYNARLAAAINEGGGPSAFAPHPAQPAQAPVFGTMAPQQGAVSTLDPRLLEYAKWAQRQANARSRLGITIPGYVNEAASLPFKYFEPGANAALQAQITGARQNATNQSDLFYKPRIEADTEAAKNAPLVERAERQAIIDRLSEQLKQERAAALQPSATPLIVNGREIPVTQKQFAEIVTGQTPVPGAAAAAPGAAGGLTPGSVLLGKPSGVGTTPEGQRLVETPEGVRYEDIPGGPKARAEEVKQTAQKQTADIVTQDIGRALKLSSDGWGTTGTLGSISQSMPGTPGHNLYQILQGLKANTGFEQLSQMRATSPTGGALGPVSDVENKLLQSVLGSLEQSQGKEQFEFNLRRLHNHYMDVVNGSPEKLDAAVKAGKLTPEQRDIALAKRYDLSASSAPAGGLPKGVPAGSKPIGTYQGKPVFELPDGSRKVLQ